MRPPDVYYHAFISCAPSDNVADGRRWADWLRHALEGFDVPEQMAGQRTPAGPVPSRLYPVFVADGKQLTPATNEAIEESRMLIVVCSPGAAQCARVIEEIRLFKKTGRDRVLALVVDGAPDARRAEYECLPETLKFEVTKEGKVDREWRLHPLSVDIRVDNRGGFTTAAAYRAALEAAREVPAVELRARVTAYAEELEAAKVRIVAAVLGVPPAELAKRDVASQAARLRRGRRWTLIAASLLALAGAAGGYFAWREHEERQAALDERSRASELASSIQHDLREKLEPVGQLASLADANERLVSHLSLVTRNNDDPKLLTALATALADAIDIHMAGADYPSALTAAQTSMQVQERIAKAGPLSSANKLRGLITRRRGAQILVRMNQQLAALAQADSARKLGAELMRDEPGDLAIAFEAAGANLDAGEILAGVGKPIEARSALNAGREIIAKLAAKDPADIEIQRALAEAHTRLGDLSQQGGVFPEAMGYFRDAEKVIAALATIHPENLAVQSSVAFVRKRLGLALALQRDFAAAAEQQRAVLEITERLAKRESWNRSRQFEYVEALQRLGETLLQLDAANRTEALTLFQMALDYLAASVKDTADPRATKLRTDIETLKNAALRGAKLKGENRMNGYVNLRTAMLIVTRAVSMVSDRISPEGGSLLKENFICHHLATETNRLSYL